MSALAFLWALSRALPIALCLPLPGRSARVALGLVLAFAGAGAPGLAQLGAASLSSELALGLMLGLCAALPLLALRYAGLLVGSTLALRAPMAAIYAALAWVLFGAAGGCSRLLSAYLESYARWPVGASLGVGIETLAIRGQQLLGLTATLALPTLLALAVLELCAAVIARFERGAVLPVQWHRLLQGARPLLATLLLLASLGAISRGVAAATQASWPPAVRSR